MNEGDKSAQATAPVASDRRVLARHLPALLLLPLLGSCADREAATLVVPLKEEPELAARLDFHGRSAWFMFDTGAGAHTLADWFVEAAGMEVDDDLGGELQARDSTGQTVEVRVVHGERGRLPNGDEVFLESAIVADFPPFFEREEGGGLLNPQLLAGGERAAVLDLRIPELRFERFDHAVRRLGAAVMEDEDLRICSDAEAPVANLLYAVRAHGPGGSAWLQLDTGAGSTSVASGSPLIRGAELEPGGKTMGVAGIEQTHLLARDLPMAFAAQRVVLDVEVVERTHGGCGEDGLLGRDALGRCALVLARDAVAIGCDQRPAPAR